MIYFIQDDIQCLIKIGFTARCSRLRLANLQTGSPAALRLLLTLPGDTAEEAKLHHRFCYAREGGEWFRPVRALLAFLADHREDSLTEPQDPFDPLGVGFGLPVIKRLLVSVAEELLRRKGCRSGLAGVRVLFSVRPDEVFQIYSSSWDRGQQLRLSLLPALSRSELEEEDRRGIFSAADYQPPPSLVRGIDPAHCTLLSEWPTTCGCWFSTDDG